jgi:hypothetical protein
MMPAQSPPDPNNLLDIGGRSMTTAGFSRIGEKPFCKQNDSCVGILPDYTATFGRDPKLKRGHGDQQDSLRPEPGLTCYPFPTRTRLGK